MDRYTSPLTMGQRAALAMLRGQDEWRTAQRLRVRDKTLYGLASLGAAVWRRQEDGTIEWNAAHQAVEREAA